MTTTNRVEQSNPNSLLVETQFATNLIVDGLRKLATVPTNPEMAQWGSNERNYTLHIGMYSYVAGLERLCKLTISCNEYVATGKFPPLRDYQHWIQKLLDAVEGLPSPSTSPGATANPANFLTRPADTLAPDLMKLVERFAASQGRYEHLDSLSKESAEVKTYNDWSALAARAPVTKEIQSLIMTKHAIATIFESEMMEAGLEATMQSMVDELSLPLDEPSVGVVMSLFRTARWVAANLDLATFYTGKDLPLLGEVVSPKLIQPSADFFKYQIVRIEDEYVVDEELTEAFTRHNQREAELDAEELAEGEF